MPFNLYISHGMEGHGCRGGAGGRSNLIGPLQDEAAGRGSRAGENSLLNFVLFVSLL